MVLITLACLALLGVQEEPQPIPAPSPPPSSPSLVSQYQQLRTAAGRGAADHVRLALWCEAHGLNAERLRHLALAVLVDPGYAPARGLLGLVLSNGRWLTPDTLAQNQRDDAARAQLLADYDARRSTTPYTASGQWGLALWAEARGLSEQAKAHLIVVTRLDPSREAAWKRLGYRRHRGAWATDAQINAEKAEAEAQRLADRYWRPFLEHRRVLLQRRGQRAEALRDLGAITDPRAVASVVQVFGGTGEADQRVAVLILSQISSPLSSLGLAHLAVASGSPEVRDEALEALVHRDVRDFIDPLIRLVRAPWRGTVRPVAGPGAVGELFVEGDDVNLSAVVRSPVLSSPAAQALFNGNLLGPRLLDLNDITPVVSTRPAEVPANAPASRDRDLARLDLDNARRAEQALEARVAQVRDANRQIEFRNGRVVPVLERVTGQNFGSDRRAWARWSTDHAGYASQSSSDSAKPTITEEISVAYQTQLPTPPVVPGRISGHAACFAAGTPVRTMGGERPIESIQVGDLVLVQDARTGALTYQAVVKAFHNPPNATLRVKLDTDEVVATGIHRFWRAGVGWVMARDLKVGDLLRVVGGTARVVAVDPDQVQPVFNLEVAEGRSFFVGRVGALVHDNTLVEATPEPFDAPPSVPAAKAIAP